MNLEIGEKKITKFPLNKRSKNNDVCPICGRPNLGLSHIEYHGFFKLKGKKVVEYTCINCGCEWFVEEEV